MLKKILIALILTALISSSSIYIYKKTIPKKGTILRYENFRGYEIPIKANGRGGTYRWMGDVPWDVFTIEEKFDFVRVGGGYFNEKDIGEIIEKYLRR